MATPSTSPQIRDVQVRGATRYGLRVRDTLDGTFFNVRCAYCGVA